MKTNRTVYRKVRIGGKGRARKAMANTSHNTGKKDQTRMRRLKKRVTVDSTNEPQLKKLLPYRSRH